MTRFRVIFFPPEGERHSPFDILLGLYRVRRVAIQQRLEDFEALEYEEWPRSWSKRHTDDLYQFTSGDYRVMFALDSAFLVVVHIFRKSGQKTPQRETERALNNLEAYRVMRGK